MMKIGFVSFARLWTFALSAAMFASVANSQSITHQINLPAGESWCSDDMINGLLTQINALRAQNNLPALPMDSVGMKDAEIRATQFIDYMSSHTVGSPGFNPHEGYDTTAASLGYNIISENLAYLTSDPVYIVYAVWQDSLHLAAMLARDANVAGVSCVISGTPYWTFEPGQKSSATTNPTAPSNPTPPTNPTPPATNPTPPATNPTPPASNGSPQLDSEEAAFLTLINNYRAQNGAGPLQVSIALQNSASWMSNDLATNNYASHTDSLGRDPHTRMTAFGYPYSPWGENIAGGFSDAQTAFNQWMTACDPDASGNCTYAHRQNMLSGGFVVIGIGRAFNANSSYGWYWTTDFGGFLDQTLATGSTGTGSTGAGSTTPAAPPAITSFVANPSSVTAGQSTTLSWSVSGANTVSIDNSVGDVSGGTSKVVAPSQTVSYTLTASNGAGSSTAMVTIVVNPATVTSGSGTSGSGSTGSSSSSNSGSGSSAGSTGSGPSSGSGVSTGSAPQGLAAPVIVQAAARSGTEVDVAWTESSPNIASYQVIRNGLVIAWISGSTLSYDDVAVNVNTTYSYTIRAYDSLGNYSPLSNAVQVTTPQNSAPQGCPAPATDAFTGCYYPNSSLAGSPALVRTDPEIMFYWGSSSPSSALPAFNFSAHWEGNFTFEQGTYIFTLVASDGMRLYIDNQLILNNWQNQLPNVSEVTANVSQGTHLVTVDYYEQTGWAAAQVSWQKN